MNIPINAVLPCRGCKADLQHKHTGGVVGTMRLKYACSGCSHVTEYDETSLRNALAAVVKDSDQTEPTPSPASTNGAAEVAEVYGYRLSRDDFWNAERFPSRQSALLQAVIAHSLPTGARVYVAVLAPDVLFSDEREHMIEQSEIAQANAIMRLSSVTGRRPIATAADVAKREQPPAAAPTAEGSATAEELGALRDQVKELQDRLSIEERVARTRRDRIERYRLALRDGGYDYRFSTGEDDDIDWLRTKLAAARPMPAGFTALADGYEAIVRSGLVTHVEPAEVHAIKDVSVGSAVDSKATLKLRLEVSHALRIDPEVEVWLYTGLHHLLNKVGGPYESAVKLASGLIHYLTARPIVGDDAQLRAEVAFLRSELEREKALHHEDRISLGDLEKAMVAGGFDEELGIYDADWLRAELRDLAALRDKFELTRLELDDARDERDHARRQRDDQSTKLLALIDERRSERVVRWWKTYDTVLPGLRVQRDMQEAHRQAKDHADLAHGPLPRSGHSVSFEAREREMSVPGNDANGSVESGDEVFPKGWARGKTGLGEPSIFIDHVSGACVWASDGAWAWSPNGTTGCVHGDRKAARIEAMAAALGFQIVGNREPPYGNSVDGSTLWTWRWHNVTTDIVEVGDAWKYTRENAALAALAFDVEQRKGSTKSGRAYPSPVGDLVRCVDDRGLDGQLRNGTVYRVVRTAVVGGGLELGVAPGPLGTFSPDRFVLIEPTQVPPGFRAAGGGAFRLESNRYTGVAETYASSETRRWHWHRHDGERLVGGGYAPTMHEAMRLARGLERVDQLWSAP